MSLKITIEIKENEGSLDHPLNEAISNTEEAIQFQAEEKSNLFDEPEGTIYYKRADVYSLQGTNISLKIF